MLPNYSIGYSHNFMIIFSYQVEKFYGILISLSFRIFAPHLVIDGLVTTSCCTWSTAAGCKGSQVPLAEKTEKIPFF